VRTVWRHPRRTHANAIRTLGRMTRTLWILPRSMLKLRCRMLPLDEKLRFGVWIGVRYVCIYGYGRTVTDTCSLRTIVLVEPAVRKSAVFRSWRLAFEMVGRGQARWTENPQIDFFWLGAYAGCPKSQTFHFSIVMRYFEVRYLVYYQIT
jgi:hypothetical protein